MDTIKLKISKILQVAPALNQLASMKLPFKVSYRISRTLDSVAKEQEAFEKTRKNMVETLADKNEDGTPIIENNAYKISQENQVAFNKEYESMLDEEVDVKVMKSNVSDFGDIQIEPYVIAALAGIVINEEEA